MVKKFIFWSFLLIPPVLYSQEIRQLNLKQAYELSEKNYPIIRQKDLIRQTADLSIANLNKNYLPQVSLLGQATYQSDVTSIPKSLPVSIEPLSRDQYRVVADISQVVFDGGVTKQQKVFQQLNTEVEEQRTDVELYRLKERINQLYLGILFLDEQLKQTDLVKADIKTGINRVEAQVQQGVAFRSGLNMLQAELLKTDQRYIEIEAARKGFVDALNLFIGQPLHPNVQLEKPESFAVAIDSEITRPELRFYSSQQQLIGQQVKMINSRNLPKASLFAQGGYGRPGLNMLENEFSFYYTGGVRLTWSLGNLYTKKKEKEIVKINQRMVDIQKETFLLNTNSLLKQQQAEIDKMLKMVASDYEIIRLRKSVTDAAKAQLENGVITANDYLKEVNAEDQARQMLITHQVQLIQAQINYQTISGKQ